MTKKKIVSALIGLTGAINNNGKTQNTDAIVREALLSFDADETISRIHREKYTISPNCETCQSPCGYTSDYDIARFEQASARICQLKEQIMEELTRLAVIDPLPEVVYKAIAYLGYDMTEETYKELLEEMQR